MFGGLGMWELLLIFFIILLFFGARRLPEIGSSLGKGIREFKDSVKEIEGGNASEISGGQEEASSSSKTAETATDADRGPAGP
jgi:sec-independent protein translocase protein TatA